MFGYPTNDDYYHDASPVHRLKSVQVPMLCLNAADDVFSPSHGEPWQRWMPKDASVCRVAVGEGLVCFSLHGDEYSSPQGVKGIVLNF